MSLHAGRAQETYGEDPYLSARMAVTFTRTLQNRSADHPFMQTASMARHYLGFHGASDLPNAGEEWVSPQWLADMHLPSYEGEFVGKFLQLLASQNSPRRARVLPLFLLFSLSPNGRGPS